MRSPEPNMGYKMAIDRAYKDFDVNPAWALYYFQESIQPRGDRNLHPFQHILTLEWIAKMAAREAQLARAAYGEDLGDAVEVWDARMRAKEED
jgi:hypothetical protein